MKIALFHDLPTGGGLSSLYEFVKQLSKKHQFDFFAIAGRETHPIFDLQPFVKNIFIFGQDRPTENYTSHLNRIINDFYGLVIEPRIEKEIAAKINSKNYDVALVSHSRFLEAPFLLKYLKTPTVYLCPGPPRQFYEYNLRVPESLPLINRLYESGLRQIRLRFDRQNALSASVIASHSIFASEAIKMWYDRNSTPIYPGVDPTIFKPRATRKLNQVLVVGNPEPQKAVDQAIISLSLIPQNKRPRLVVVSPRLISPNPLKKLAENKQVQVTWLNSLNQKQMAKAYSESLLTLSVSYREHFGCHALESLACETPVVAVNEGGYRENIITGKTGFLVERDPAFFAQTIEKLIDNPTLAKKLGQNGRRDVLSRWTWAIVTKKLEQLLQATVNGPRN